MEIKVADIAGNKLNKEQTEALQTYFQSGGTWQDLLEMDTNDVEDIYAIGHTHYEKEEYEQALAAFSALVQINPYSSKHWIAIGATLQGQELYHDAMAAYELAETLEEQIIEPLFYSAQCAYALGNKPETRDFLKKTIFKSEQTGKGCELAEKAKLILEQIN